eukprot:15354263-Ditylum_brightwellii.AAC.1
MGKTTQYTSHKSGTWKKYNNVHVNRRNIKLHDDGEITQLPRKLVLLMDVKAKQGTQYLMGSAPHIIKEQKKRGEPKRTPLWLVTDGGVKGPP